MIALKRGAAGLFAIALAAAAWSLGDGPAGWVYLLCYGLAVLPGLPLGFALFGPSHAGGWIAGVLIGYALTAFAIWAPIAAHVPSIVAFAAAWAVVGAIAWIATRGVQPLVVLPPWTASASASLLLVLVVTLAIATPPLANVGRTDDAGNRRYRAYFTADFVWHTALTAEIAKYSMPPRNPYLAHRTIHYYWTYYLFPAAMAASGPPQLRDVERCLKLNALMTGLLLMSAVFLSAWSAVARPWAAGAAATLALLASSAEGLVAMYRLWSRGQPMGALRNLNIDAISSWWFQGHRIDGLQRCLWYVPQHSMAYGLGLIAISVAAAAGSSASLGAIVLTGMALGCSVAFNPLVGGIFALAYGLAVIVDAVRRPRTLQVVARHAVAAVPVLIAIAWCSANQMVEGAGGALQFGLLGASRQAPLWNLLLSLGPLLFAGALGLLPSRGAPFGPVIPSVILCSAALALMHFVRLSVDQAWVAFRAGQIVIVALVPLAARFIAAGFTVSTAGAGASHRGSGRILVTAVVLLCLLVGLPTTVIDEYNAQDTDNTAMAADFPWTIVIAPEQQRAFSWIRTNTAANAIVQMEPNVRGRSTWSLIPSFAERRMTAGLPISLMSVPEFHERSDRVRAIYQGNSAAEASQIARSLRIDYLYVDGVERGAYPAAAKFDTNPALFERVFNDGPVSVYRVR